MSTLFPLPQPDGEARTMPRLFDLPELPRHADLSREPAGPHHYSLDALNSLLQRKGIGLGQAMDDPDARRLLHVRTEVLAGRWPLSVYTEEHECDCEHCHCADVQVYWHCPRCGNELVVEDALEDGWMATCETSNSADHPEKKGCGAEFVARKLGTGWHPFLVVEGGECG